MNFSPVFDQSFFKLVEIVTVQNTPGDVLQPFVVVRDFRVPGEILALCFAFHFLRVGFSGKNERLLLNF